MPTVHNGIGTWYWGKTNVHSHRAKCPHCGVHTTLTSYDTTLYAVLFFVPMIPLGKRRVFQMCESCQRHNAMKLSAWKKLRDEAVGKTLVDYEDTPLDAEKAKKAIGAAMAFEDEHAFLAIAMTAGRDFNHDASVQADLAEGLWFFGRTEQSLAVTRRACELKPDPAQGKLLGARLILLGQVNEATAILRPLLEEKNLTDYGVAQLLAIGFQSMGLHKEALDVLNSWAEKNPQLTSDSEHKRLTALSQRHLATGKHIDSKVLSAGATRTTEGTKWITRLAPWVGPAIITGSISLYVLACVNDGNSYKIYIAGGLTQAYDVKISGVPVKVLPQTAQPFHVAMGDVTIEAPDARLRIATTTVHIETPFWGRPFNRTAFVINPDGAAVVLLNHIYYAQSSPQAGSQEPHTGKNLHEFKSIDYPFTPSPSSISVKGTAQVAKTQLEVFVSNDAEEVSSALIGIKEDEKARAFLRARLAHEPKADATLLALASALLPGDEFQKVIEPRLADRPLDVEVHRAYQNSVEVGTPGRDLAPEYQKLLDNDPGNTALMYLLARVVRDDEKSGTLLAGALAGKPPSAYAANALAYRAMARGEFAVAYELIRHALNIDPKNQMTLALRPEVLIANGRYDELIEADKKQNAGTFSIPAVQHAAMALAVQGKATEALRAIDAAAGDIKALAGDEIAATVVAALKQVASYQSGDAQAYVKQLDADKTPRADFHRALLKSDLDAMENAAQKDDPTLRDVKLLALLALHAGKRDMADRQIAIIAKAWARDIHEHRVAAQVLTTSEPPPAADAIRCVLQTSDKCFLLSVLALKHPRLRSELIPLAQKLNFDPSFPHLAIKRILDETASAGPSALP
jgi:tetratricopeptide (TPR) repeat protein